MQPLSFTPFPELRTDRLLLRRMRSTDANELYFLRSDDAVMMYINREKEKSVESAAAFIEKINKVIDNNESVLWGITFADEPDHLIGNICLWQFQPENSRCEIGYVLHPSYWGKGIMKESAIAVIDYGTNVLELHSMEAHINPANIASGRLLQSLGFEKEAHFRENFYYNGEYLDSVVFGKILKKV